MSSKTKCGICGREVDYLGGGCALMMAFCRKHDITLSNVSYCAECYDNLLKGKFKAFVDAACLEIGGMEDSPT